MNYIISNYKNYDLVPCDIRENIWQMKKIPDTRKARYPDIRSNPMNDRPANQQTLLGVDPIRRMCPCLPFSLQTILKKNNGCSVENISTIISQFGLVH